MAKILVTRPSHDVETCYLDAWMGLIEKDAQKRGIPLIQLLRERATQKNTISTLRDASGAFFNGHGTPNTIQGHKNEILIDDGNVTCLSQKVVFARACEAGASLGPLAISKGCTAFIGYKRKFRFWAQSLPHPLEDKFAGPIIEASNAVMHALLKGHTVEEAVDEMRRKTIQNVLDQFKHKGADRIVQTLLHNMNGVVAQGNLQATI